MMISRMFKSLRQPKATDLPAQQGTFSGYLEGQSLIMSINNVSNAAKLAGCTISYTEVYGDTLYYTVTGESEDIEDFAYVLKSKDMCCEKMAGGPPHKASDRCESGKYPHCSCGVCFD